MDSPTDEDNDSSAYMRGHGRWQKIMQGKKIVAVEIKLVQVLRKPVAHLAELSMSCLSPKDLPHPNPRPTSLKRLYNLDCRSVQPRKKVSNKVILTQLPWLCNSNLPNHAR